MRATRSGGYLFGSFRITTTPEPNLSRFRAKASIQSGLVPAGADGRNAASIIS
jgi:hypothetical protein